MKILVIVIAASVTVAVIASISLFALPDNRPTCFSCPEIRTSTSQILAQNNSSVQNVTTVIIPPGAEDASSGKNYEPQFLHLAMGVNNTVKWINVGLASSSVIADNHDDPDFYNATNISPVAYEYHVKSQNFLTPGESFEYTFTKVGYFGYHSDPHPWMRGWVLVLPQDTGNLTQTVVLNDTDIMGPCAIFEIPCPNTHVFTAQKFGTNIYIEKMTINGVDNYAIVNPEGYCVYPTNGYRNPCTNSVDLAILRLVGVG
jgi:plastocyanin